MTYIKNPIKITKLLNSKDIEEQALGYESFLRRTHWKFGSTPEDLKLFACSQLHVNPRHVLASKIKRIEPALLWASQDGLESEKLNMVQAAYTYLKEKKMGLPPIVVWNFYDSQRVRLVIHDGHHRSYFSHRLNIKLNAVILEPLGNYCQMEDKFRYAFQIRKRVTDLPVSRHGGML